MIRRPPRSTQSRSSAASDVYKRQVYKSPLYYACVVLCALLTFTIDHFIQIWEFHIVQNTSNFCRLWSVTYDPGDYEGNSYKMQMLKIIDLKHRDQPLPALSTPQGSMQLSR
eukprot:TRINITY_DN673_c0_g1_i3.p1 TRINITY_DN673_c0_g1~~TRINITY_DN673_c0_g1_i3.p1  ORF type:complete len:120 (+),score=44.09 TRINITY_DN673_c0_g1_i3:25-360(+)